MLSPELLRGYTLFDGLNKSQYKEVAMISEEVSFPKGTIIFNECDEADSLFLLIKGTIDLYYGSEEGYYPTFHKKFLAGEINPGEVFGISALIEPYVLSETARAATNCSTIKIHAKTLRELFVFEPDLGCRFMVHISKAIMERLGFTRIQHPVAWSA